MTGEELLRTIEEARREGWTEFDLRNKGLTTLPPEIAQLSNLTILKINNNQLTELSHETIPFR